MSPRTISLNGVWKAVADSTNQITLLEAKEQFLHGATDITVPANWNKGGLQDHIGTVWYKTKFVIPESAIGKLCLLCFQGVDYFTEVWVDGQKVGSHEGYFQKFEFDISDTIKPDENELLVKVVSPFEEPGTVWPDRKRLIKGIFGHHDCRPGSSDLQHGQDRNTGGIWNNVEIEIAEEFTITNVQVTAELKEDLAVLQADITCYAGNQGEESRPIVLAVKAPTGETFRYERDLSIAKGYHKSTFVFNIQSPELWWSYDTGEARLYTLTIQTGAAELYSTKFGIREVKLDENGTFYLNGQRLFLRGTNIIPEQNLSELSDERIKLIVHLMKEANINIVRIHAHVNRQELYDAFDENGILVWQDFALQWTYDESLAFAENAASQIKDMVQQFYNHPSIAFWCCHNEPGPQIDTLDSILFDCVIKEDTSRIVRRASNYEEHAYDGWYWGAKEHYAATPMGPLVTEFGAQGLPVESSMEKIIPKAALFPPDYLIWKYHNFQTDQTFNIAGVKTGNSIEDFIENSQRYQADLLTTAIHFYRRKRFQGITGIFQFMLIDCWESVSWSVVDYWGVRKKGYYALRDAFQPLLLSVRLRQYRHYYQGKLGIDLFIINDLYREFPAALLRIKSNKFLLYEKQMVCVPADGLLFIRFEDINSKLPAGMKAGVHQIDVCLQDENRNILAKTIFEIEIVNEP